MKYRTPANREIVERDDVPDSLIDAGVYVPIEEPESRADEDDGQTSKRRKPRP